MDSTPQRISLAMDQFCPVSHFSASLFNGFHLCKYGFLDVPYCFQRFSFFNVVVSATNNTKSRGIKLKNIMPFTTYLLRCSDGTLYCGSTPDMERRLHEHNHLKTAAKYTRGRRPVELAYSETFETLAEARKRENAIKKLGRKEKDGLIEMQVKE